jgi:hypothetical protein
MDDTAGYIKKQYKFGIVTPTIPGREEFLARAICSVKYQMFHDYIHIICGDGFVPAIEEEAKVITCGTDRRYGYWGNQCRNYVIENYHTAVEYFLFLDDDNILLPRCFMRLSSIFTNLILSRMLRNDPRIKQEQYPRSQETIGIGQIGSLNFCIRSSVASQCRWLPDSYVADFHFFRDCARVSAGMGDDKITYIDEFLSVWCTGGA